MLFNQTALKHQRLKFAVGYDIIELVYLFDHFSHLDSVPVRRAEILADAVLQCFRLTDINNFAVYILHNIHAR